MGQITNQNIIDRLEDIKNTMKKDCRCIFTTKLYEDTIIEYIDEIECLIRQIKYSTKSED